MDSLADCLVHPIAGATLLATLKLNALQGEALSNQAIEIATMGERITPKLSRVELRAVKIFSDALVDGPVKKSNLPFEILLMIQETIAD